MKVPKIIASFLVVFTLCSTASVTFAIDEDKAWEYFEQGHKYFSAGKYAEARAEYDKAYKEFPDPNILYMIGRCYEMERNYKDAVRIYKQVVDMPNVDDEVKSKAEEGIASFEPLIPKEGTLVIKVSQPNSAILIDGEEIGVGTQASATLPYAKYKVTVRNEPKYQTYEDIVEIDEPTITVVVQLIEVKEDEPVKVVQPLPTETSPLILPGWISLGVGAGTAIFGLVMNIMYIDTRNEAEKVSVAGDYDTFVELESQMETEQLLTILGYSIGGVGLIAGGVLLYLGYTWEPEKKEGVSFSPMTLPDGVGFTFQWKF